MDQNLVQQCPVCSELIPHRTHGGGNPKLFCSEKCRKKQAGARRYQKRKEQILTQIREYRLANIGKVKERQRRHQKSNPEKYAEASKRYRMNNPEKAKENYKRWANSNPDVVAQRRAMKAQATPPWLTKSQKDEIKAIYLECRSLTKQTGTIHHVDHIYPLAGTTSCGLHVPWNLRTLTADENYRKGNKLPEAA